MSTAVPPLPPPSDRKKERKNGWIHYSLSFLNTTTNMAVVAQVSSSLCTSIRGTPFLSFSLCLQASHNYLNLFLYIQFPITICCILDVCVVSSSARTSAISRLPLSNPARIGSTFTTGSPLCMLFQLSHSWVYMCIYIYIYTSFSITTFFQCELGWTWVCLFLVGSIGTGKCNFCWNWKRGLVTFPSKNVLCLCRFNFVYSKSMAI